MVPSKAEERLIERMLSGRDPVEITQSKENVVDPYAEIAARQQQANNNAQQVANSAQVDANNSEEIALRQSLAEAQRDLAKALRAHTPTTDESNLTAGNATNAIATTTTTTESLTVDSPYKGR